MLCKLFGIYDKPLEIKVDDNIIEKTATHYNDYVMCYGVTPDANGNDVLLFKVGETFVCFDKGFKVTPIDDITSFIITKETQTDTRVRELFYDDATRIWTEKLFITKPAWNKRPGAIYADLKDYLKLLEPLYKIYSVSSVTGSVSFERKISL